MIRVTDRAVVKFLERTGALDIDQIRRMMAGAIERSREACERAGRSDYVVIADGLRYVVEKGELVTVLHAAGRQRR